MIKLIGFDLDNTLYDHKQYVKKAYKDISTYINKKYNINEKIYFNWIFKRWLKKGSSYNKIFKESYQYFKLKNFKKDINKILYIYRNSTPNLALYNGIINIFNKLKENYKLVLITDGKSRTQNYKINNLNIRSYFKKIYISGEYGNRYYKPSTKMFELCLSENQIDNNEIIYIGDNPFLDYPPCKKLGIKFMRIKAGEYKNLGISSSIKELKLDEIKKIDKWVDDINEKNISNNLY